MLNPALLLLCRAALPRGPLQGFRQYLLSSHHQKAIPIGASPFVLREEVIEVCRRSVVRASGTEKKFCSTLPCSSRAAPLCRGGPSGVSAICTLPTTKRLPHGCLCGADRDPLCPCAGMRLGFSGPPLPVCHGPLCRNTRQTGSFRQQMPHEKVKTVPLDSGLAFFGNIPRCRHTERHIQTIPHLFKYSARPQPNRRQDAEPQKRND